MWNKTVLVTAAFCANFISAVRIHADSDTFETRKKPKIGKSIEEQKEDDLWSSDDEAPGQSCFSTVPTKEQDDLLMQSLRKMVRELSIARANGKAGAISTSRIRRLRAEDLAGFPNIAEDSAASSAPTVRGRYRRLRLPDSLPH